MKLFNLKKILSKRKKKLVVMDLYDSNSKLNAEYWTKVLELNSKYTRMKYLQNEYNRMMNAGISPRSPEVRKLVEELLVATNEYGGY